MDYKDISERIALLTQEIRDLRRMDTALHCDGSQRISRASRPKERELRLRQIREELSKMMLKPRESSKKKPTDSSGACFDLSTKDIQTCVVRGCRQFEAFLL